MNVLEIRSDRGYRHFKLYCGDITSVDFPVDLLCVSAFKGSYIPTPRSVIGALKRNRDIDVQALALNPELDLRSGDSSFITAPTRDPQIGRVLCLEMRGTDHESLSDNLDALLSTLYKAELKGMRIQNIMLPLLGTGDQRIDPEIVMELLIRKAEYLLMTSRNIQEVLLVDIDPERVRALNASMNRLLGRQPSIFRQDRVIGAVIASIREIYKRHEELLSDKSFMDVLRELNKPEIDAMVLSIEMRSLSEYILNTLYPEVENLTLNQKIRYLDSRHTPPWMYSYFHLLRVFGNAHVHDGLKRGMHQVAESDLAIVLFGLERVILYYLESVVPRPPQPSSPTVPGASA
jgi:hypothetical protein